MIVQNPPGRWRYLGIVIAFVSVPLVTAVVVAIGIHFGLQSLFGGDIRHVATFYRLRESQKDDADASSFWVAEVETGLEGKKELVRCVGLGVFNGCLS